MPFLEQEQGYQVPPLVALQAAIMQLSPNSTRGPYWKAVSDIAHTFKNSADPQTALTALAVAMLASIASKNLAMSPDAYHDLLQIFEAANGRPARFN